MTTLNAQQLAFILDIKKDDARAKMLTAWEAEGNKIKCSWVTTKSGTRKLNEEIDHPEALEIEMLARRLNIPTLQEMVNDIESNYTKRPAARKYILQDYPEKKIQNNNAPNFKLKLPAGLRGLISADSRKEIYTAWKDRFKAYVPRSYDKI